MENNPPRRPGAAKWLLIFGLFLVANSAYLAAFGDPNLFYVANALLHPLLGIVAGILLMVFANRHREFLAGATGTIARLFGVVTAAAGVYLMIVGMTRP